MLRLSSPLACAIAIALAFPNPVFAGPGAHGQRTGAAAVASAATPRCDKSHSGAGRSPETMLAPCSSGADDRQASAAPSCEQRLVGSRNMRATFCKPQAAGEMLADAKP